MVAAGTAATMPVRCPRQGQTHLAVVAAVVGRVEEALAAAAS